MAVRNRTTDRDLLDAAIADLCAALHHLGVECDADGAVVRTRVDDAVATLGVLPVAYATGDRVDSLLTSTEPSGRSNVVVSDRITADARHRLAEAGWSWFDRRGRLRLRCSGLLVDAEVPPALETPTPTVEPIRGRAGLAVAFRLLAHPAGVVSPTRSGLGYAPSTISEATSRLRDVGLVDEDGLPVLPELFWTVAERWNPKRAWLASLPDPDRTGAGWCMSGTAAAAALGAPVVSTRNLPDLYVSSPAALTIAVRRYGAAHDAGTAAASIAVAPVDVCADSPITVDGWPTAHPVAVALDLAQDRARGREILEDWSPPERVW